MQPKAWPNIKRIALKETTLFFTSAVAYLFLAAFGAVSFFAVFWGATFFARNLADIRPLFEWMPLLLLFLTSAVTMRMWSEERRQGTLEHVLTTPVPLWHFVLGKYLACLLLLGAALAITLPLPLTVSLLGPLDWGPVLAGYLATFLLGASYLAIGLFVSSQSSNQIVSLLASVGICGLLYLLGSGSFTALFSQETADWLKLLGTGARFESITRGVVDLRDLAYYCGLILAFLSLNAYVLESERWSSHRVSSRRGDWRVIIGLILANALGLNLWLGQLRVRLDVTEGKQYSLSSATQEQLESLQEPLQIKAYFSQKTHPLLAPLVPQLKDLLKEYEEVSEGRVRVDFIDPQQDPEAEQQAKEEFGIEPVPFQVTDRYEASIVSSYFNVVLKYGDAFEVLSFDDLIEVKAHAMSQFDVQLRNPEYDITRAIKKVLDSYQGESQLFDTLGEAVTLQVLVSDPAKLPEKLAEFRTVVQSLSEELKEKSDGKLQVEFLDPDRDPQAKALVEQYGFQAMASSLLDQNRFYFYLVLRQGEKVLQLPLGDLAKASLERNFNAGLKRFGKGFSKSIALVSAQDSQYQQVKTYLQEELNVETEDLKDGSVSGGTDVLVLLAPENLGDKEIYAIDQFLMRGGTVVAATSPYQADLSGGDLRLTEKTSGLEDWLSHFGLKFGQGLVLDPQCAALPIPVTRYVGGHRVQTMQLIDYPYFLDVREDGWESDSPIFTGLTQLTLPWASPLVLEEKDNLKALVCSTAESWTSPSTDVAPQVDDSGNPLFYPTGLRSRQVLAALVNGPMDSYFQSDKKERLDKVNEVAQATITRSTDSAKLIVVSSPSMFSDQIIRLMGGLGAGDPLANLNLLANLADWSTEDQSLLSIRSRSHFKRTLYPLDKQKQVMWEVLNYTLALLILAAIALLSRLLTQRKRRDYQDLLQG